MATYRLRLAKPDLKFAASHFTLFANGRAERLHGHNYRVSVVVEGASLGADGLLLDVAALKARIRELCAALDERVLLPGRTDAIEIERDATRTKVRVGGVGYSLPSSDVVELPIANVCVELLAEHLWRELAAHLPSDRVDSLSVEVEETEGQSGSYSAALG